MVSLNGLLHISTAGSWTFVRVACVAGRRVVVASSSSSHRRQGVITSRLRPDRVENSVPLESAARRVVLDVPLLWCLCAVPL